MTAHWTGCLPRVSKVGDGLFPVMPESMVRPRSEWETARSNLGQHVWHIINQGRQNSCCGCAGVGIMMLDRARQGLDRVVLSQAVPYHFGNGGRDGGMFIDTCLQMLREYGTCPVSVVPEYDWRKSNWREDWRAIGKAYTPAVWADVPTYEHAQSRLAEGHPVLYGAMGHAVVRIDNGLQTELCDLNSWDRSWGTDGIGRWASEREFARGIEGGYGAWTLLYATDPPLDGDL